MSLLADTLLVAVGSIASGIVLLAIRNRPAPGATPLAALMGTVAAWAGVHLLEHHTAGALNEAFATLEWVTLLPLGFVWLVFVIEYAGYGARLTRPVLAGLFAWPALLSVALWLPESVPVAGSVAGQLADETGPVFWGHVGVSYGLLGIGSVLLLDHLRTQPRVFRLQGTGILLGLVAAWGASAISIFNVLGDLHLHALPVGFVLMGAAFLWAVLRQDLTSMTPVERRTVMEALSVGVLAVDDEGRVTSVNRAARVLLGIPDDRTVVGDALEHVESVGGDLVAWLDDADGARDILELDLGDRILSCQRTPLRRADDPTGGWVVLATDVTESRRTNRALERQNERLERFASVVSHDLRSPLTVAERSLELAETPDDDHIDRAQRALDRMYRLIDDLLSLAREGNEIDAVEPVSLAAVVEASTDAVEAEAGEIRVDVDATVLADRGRLRQLFENLFRNAVEHAQAPVTVEVGELTDGFYVEDDGPGIPPDEREAVFKAGYSTADDGTGFGLAIVREIVEAHGWDLELRRGDAGGARFEVTEVEVVDPGAHERAMTADLVR
ncbi:MAG: histidine kinase N-terminal 7TM domain-containing protein [Halobacteriales archaeon]